MEGAAPDLRQYLTLLRRRKVSLLLVTLAVTAGALVISGLQSPTYEASAQLLREAQPVDPLAQPVNSAPQAQRSLNNEIRELESTKVREEVSKAYTGPLPVSVVKGSVVASDADVIRVTGRGGDPDEVAKLVNTYVETYVKFRTEQYLAVLLETGRVVRQKVDEQTKKLAEVSAPIIALDNQIATAENPRRNELQRQRTVLAEELAPQITAIQSQLDFFQQQLGKVELSADLRQSGSLRLLAPATVPEAPVSPKPLRNAAIGLFLGLLLGSAAAVARERLDDTVRDKATLEAESQLATLGLIPRLRRRHGALNEVVTIAEHSSVAAEAYRTLRTSVKFLSVEDDCRVFQITSANAAEGKTLTAMNLAVALSQAGDRTVVVGCDLRRPRLDSLAHAHSGPGLTSVLVGDADLRQAIERHEEVDLSILRTGPIPADPSELLSSPRMAALIQALRGAYDAVVLDCPPLLPVSDSLILATYSDATLLVVSEGKTSRGNLARALELLRQVNAPVRGTVLNGTKSVGGYDYGYAYDRYAQSPPSTNGVRPRRGRNPAAPEQGTALADG